MFKYSIGRLKLGIEKSRHSKHYTPTDAIVFLTYRCTSRCSVCNMWQRPVNRADELTWSQWRPIFKSLTDNNIKNVELFGGDALLRKELLLNMIQFCTEHNIGTYFPTNSSSLTEKTITDLVNSGLGTLYISLDEVPVMDNSIRGIKRHYERATKSIELIKRIRGQQQKPRISCITTVSSLNYQHLESLNQIAFNIGADEHMIRGISEFTQEAVDAGQSLYKKVDFYLKK